MTQRRHPTPVSVLSAAILQLAMVGAVAGMSARDAIRIGNKNVPYLSNLAIGETNPGVSRAIIVIHGGLRILDEYYTPILKVMSSGPDEAWSRKTILIAPHFQKRSSASEDEHWWGGDWREGGESDGVSSYAVVDALVARLRSGVFPNLKWIVITGHSAGGQWVQRYAAFTDIDLQSVPNAAFVKFVPANPSSCVYLNEYRLGHGTNGWIVPKEDCGQGDGYNEWKYGLDGLSGYAAVRGASWARQHLPRREVELLAGEADVENDIGFDNDCAAMWQGPNRYARAENYKAFMDRFYPTNRLRLTSVPGAGHDASAIYASRQGRQALFFPD